MNSVVGKAAIPVLWQFFERWGSAEETRRADWRPIAELLHPLGLHEKRAKMLIRFSGLEHFLFIVLVRYYVVMVRPFFNKRRAKEE